VIEFSTALPYLDAIILIGQAQLRTHRWLPLMALHNDIMELPPVALIAGYRLAPDRLRQRL
jgi:hypothetical protein